MIAGETEYIVNSEQGLAAYDAFLFGNKSNRAARKSNRNSRRAERGRNRFNRRTARVKRKTARNASPTRVYRRQRRKEFVDSLGQVYRNAGGTQRVQSELRRIVNPKYNADFSKNSTKNETDSDYEVALGTSKNTKQGIPTAAYIIGGIAFVGIIGALALKKPTPND